MAMIEVVVNGVESVKSHGIYEQVKGPGQYTYRLRMWRISFWSKDHQRRTEGDWHKVSNGRRKDLGSLPLIVDHDWIEQHRISKV